MTRSKPNFSHINTPLLKEYCKKRGLLFWWKNESQGHAVISSIEVDAYVWVQRMVVGIRMKGGHELSRTVYQYPDNYKFDEKSMDNWLFGDSIGRPTTHITHHGIKVTRTPGRVKS